MFDCLIMGAYLLSVYLLDIWVTFRHKTVYIQRMNNCEKLQQVSALFQLSSLNTSDAAPDKNSAEVLLTSAVPNVSDTSPLDSQVLQSDNPTGHIKPTLFRVTYVSDIDSGKKTNMVNNIEQTGVESTADQPSFQTDMNYVPHKPDNIQSIPVILPTAADQQSRFRVVKIDSVEPVVRRGRWVCLNFPDAVASSQSVRKSCDGGRQDDVGYSSGSSVSSHGVGQNPLLCFLCDNTLPVGRSVDLSISQADTLCPAIQMLSSSDLFSEHSPSYAVDGVWPYSGKEYVTNLAGSKSPLCILTHGAGLKNVDDLTNCEDSMEKLVALKLC